MDFFFCNQCESRSFGAIAPYPGLENTDLVECRTCHLMQAYPLPTEAFLTDYYQKTFGKECNENFELTDENRRHLRVRATLQHKFAERLCGLSRKDYTAGFRVLDVGCHAGSLLSLFKEKGCEVIGLDPNPRSRFAKVWYGIGVVQKPFNQGLFEPESFDLILHSHTLEHVRNPKGSLGEFYQILKPGGFVFIEVPNETRAKITAKKVIPHLYFFTPGTLATLALSVGFQVVATRVLGLSVLSKKELFSERGVAWFKLRSKACYDVKGRFNPLAFLPLYGRLFKEERFFKQYHPEAEMLRIVLQKPKMSQRCGQWEKHSCCGGQNY